MMVRMSDVDAFHVPVDLGGSLEVDGPGIRMNCRLKGDLENVDLLAHVNNPLGNREPGQMVDDPCACLEMNEEMEEDMEGLVSSLVVEVGSVLAF